MSGLRGMMKEGWHPKARDGSKESWRGDFKGVNQVATWMGKGKDSSADVQTEHVSRPLSSLRDPASFGPPPRRGSSNTPTTPVSRAAPRRGLGEAMSSEEIPHYPDQPEEEEDKVAPPPLPYRANRTGIDPNRLPPPPVRRTESPANVTTPASRSTPNLPPRLPTRNGPSHSPSPPPPPYSESDHAIQMNQASMSRLEQAGVSVPALGIGRRDSEQSGTTHRSMNNQVNELQSRFAKMSTPASQNSYSTRTTDDRPSIGASSMEHLPNTQHNMYNNDTYSNTDVNNAAVPRPNTRGSAAPLPPNNFRQRSNEHIEAGKQKLAAFNQKHRITERIGSYFEERPVQTSSQQGQAVPPPPPPPPHPNLSRQSSNVDVEVLNRRKAPPPPPPAKKPALKATPVNSTGGGSPPPPPLPLGTKPR